MTPTPHPWKETLASIRNVFAVDLIDTPAEKVLAGFIDDTLAEIDRLEHELDKALRLSGSLMQANVKDLKEIDRRGELIGQAEQIVAEVSRCHRCESCKTSAEAFLRYLQLQRDEVTRG